MDTLLVVFNVIFLISCLSISYLFKRFYPKEINILIGYRTKRSMASNEAWNFANGYSSSLLFSYSLITVAIQVVLFLIFDERIAILVAASLWLILLVLTIVQTESKLKKL